MVPVDAEHRMADVYGLGAGQAAQQHLRAALLVGQHVGKVLAGEAGQAGLHLPRRSAHNGQVPQVDPGLPAQRVDQLHQPVRWRRRGLGVGVGDSLPVPGQMNLSPLPVQIGQHCPVGGGRVAADSDQRVEQDLHRVAASLPQHSRQQPSVTGSAGRCSTSR